MLWNLLADSSTQESGAGSIIFMVVILLAVVVFFILSKRSQKKREQEVTATLDAIQPGNKVKTIGGVCGVVVEVCPEDNTFILETGSEQSGKCYLKFDKKAVYQTDAVAKKAVAPVEAPAEETKEEAPVEAPVEEVPVEEAPVEETKTEE